MQMLPVMLVKFNFNIPSWVPEEARRIASSIAHDNQDIPNNLEILKRLLIDPRMKGVWQILLETDRKTGCYFYPVVGGEREQQRATGKVLSAAFGIGRDKLQVTTPEELRTVRERLLGEARKWEDNAREFSAFGLIDPDGNTAASAALRLARVKEEQARLALADMRDESDPMTVRRHRSNPILKGCATMIASKLQEIYAKRLESIAQTLAEVALGLESKPNRPMRLRSKWAARGSRRAV